MTIRRSSDGWPALPLLVRVGLSSKLTCGEVALRWSFNRLLWVTLSRVMRSDSPAPSLTAELSNDDTSKVGNSR